MRRLLLPALALLAAAPLAAQQQAVRTAPDLAATQVTVAPRVAPYAGAASRLIAAAMADSTAWNRIAELTDRFGPRPSGSEALEHAIDWVLARMQEDGLQNVHGERVMVPHWVRGEESATLLEPYRRKLHLLGLGGSVGTPKGGITAPVLVVSSFDELRERAAEAKGKIVLLDEPYVSYGQTVRYRVTGADSVLKYGGVATLIRSVSSFSISNPHTGNLHYGDSTRRLPAAALSVEDAMLLHRMAKRGQPVRLTLVMGARTLPDAPSRNVVAEIVGREKPDEVVVLGGHIDSWDVGQGAMDDAGGVVAAWQAVRLMKELGLRPRRTVRVVAWTNEENGTRGGRGYRAAHADAVDKHVLAMESDDGVFRPTGFGFTGSDSALAIVRDIATLLAPIGATQVETPGGGADIGPLTQAGVPSIGLVVDGTRYFWYHHSDGDTPDKLDPAEVNQCVAALAVMAYVAAEMPEPLPRAAGAAATR